MKVTAGCVDPGFNFPQPRQDGAEGRWPVFDDATFTLLTCLESLDIYIPGKDESPDLSALVLLIKLNSQNKISSLPTSLVECTLVGSDFDFSGLTKLTHLDVMPWAAFV